jgi:inosose dehydratase
VTRVANAPCSCGVLEFEAPATHAPASQVLDEMAAAGDAGAELGDWGFLPTSLEALAAEWRAATSRSPARSYP